MTEITPDTVRASAEALFDHAAFILRKAGLEGIGRLSLDLGNPGWPHVRLDGRPLACVQLELRVEERDDDDGEEFEDDDDAVYDRRGRRIGGNPKKRGPEGTWYTVQPSLTKGKADFTHSGRIYGIGDEVDAAEHLVKEFLDLKIGRAKPHEQLGFGNYDADTIAWRSRRALEREFAVRGGLIVGGEYDGCPLWAPHFERTRRQPDDGFASDYEDKKEKRTIAYRYDAWRVTAADTLAFPDLTNIEFVYIARKEGVIDHAEAQPQDEWSRTKSIMTNSRAWPRTLINPDATDDEDDEG